MIGNKITGPHGTQSSFKVGSIQVRKLNQRISASVQGTPRRGNEHIAQGIALGMMKR